MLYKSPIPEPLKETLLFSPLVKDKLFGFPLGKLQEEGSKTPQTKGVGKNSSSSGGCTDGGGGPSLTILFPLYHFGFFTCGRGRISSS
jgi:hypothetical protein